MVDEWSGRVSYRGWGKVFWSSKFSIVLSKASILHRRYLDLYWRDDYNAIRDYVDDLKNCEDIAMGVLVHREGGEARFVQGALSDSGVLSGISTKGGGKQHWSTRDNCVKDMLSMAGVELWEQDLREQSVVKFWPGFWWQLRPSTTWEWLHFDFF